MTARRPSSDEIAFIAALYPALVRFANVVAPGNEAEDVVQEAVLRTLRARRLEELDDPGAYLRTVIVRVAQLQRRRRDRWHALASRFATPESVDPEFPSDLTDLLRVPQGARAVLYLTIVEELSYADAAAIVGCSEEAARARASRALRSLRSSISEELQR